MMPLVRLAPQLPIDADSNQIVSSFCQNQVALEYEGYARHSKRTWNGLPGQKAQIPTTLVGRPAAPDCQDRGARHSIAILILQLDVVLIADLKITLLDVVPRLGEQPVAQVPEDFFDSPPQFLGRDFPPSAGSGEAPSFAINSTASSLE
jgi:hypothetical protein